MFRFDKKRKINDEMNNQNKKSKQDQDMKDDENIKDVELNKGDEIFVINNHSISP